MNTIKNINKKIGFLTVMVTSLVLLLPSSVYALSATPTPTPTTAASVTVTATPSVTPTKTTNNTTSAINNKKALADQEITRRITALEGLISQVEVIKRLSSTEVATYTSEIQSEMSSLTTLEAKINADTDLTTLNTDIQSIVNSYRVFVVYIPQMWLLVTADRMNATLTSFNTFAAKLNTRIQTDSEKGQNVANLQTDYNHIISQLTDLNSQIQNVITIANTLTPTGYPGNVTQIQQARADVKTGQNDITSALQEAKIIVDGLKALEPTPTATSPTVTTTPLSTQ